MFITLPTGPPRQSGNRDSIVVAGDRHRLEEAGHRQSLGHIYKAGGNRTCRNPVTHRHIIETDLANMKVFTFEHSCDKRERVGSAGTYQAEDACNLSRE